LKDPFHNPIGDRKDRCIIMKFGLYGINGVYNFGCEAIIRGTFRFLKDCRSDAEILYYTYNYEYDSRVLADLDIEIVKIKNKRNMLNRAINKALSFISVEKRILTFNWDELINSVDVIVSIGGDMYTIPESVRSDKKYPYYNSLADFCNRAINRGKQVVAYGASMGPWGNYKKAIDYFVRNVSKYRYCICREHMTIDYLNRHDVLNTFFQPDPAFLVTLSDEKKNTCNKKFIGINFSPLSLREVYGEYSEEMICKFSRILERVIETIDSDILLIPHVLSDVESDNDELMLRRVLESMSESYQKRTVLADTSNGFLGIKEQLHSCKYVVAARMHCAINAITEGIPAIFLSYSQKSQGMAQYVYHSQKWMLSIKKVDTDLLPLMIEMEKSWKDISSYLGNRMVEIKQEYRRLQEEQKLFK